MDLAGLGPWGGLAGASLDEASVVVAGIPYDGSAVYRKGAAQAPERLRKLSPVMPPVSEDGRLLEGLKVHDLGDLDAGGAIETGWQPIAARLAEMPPAALLTILGGDHCITIATLAAQARRHPDLAVLWVDAHPDLCDFSRGGRWTCGCAMRRALEVSQIDPRRVVIAAGRDYDPEELRFIRAHDMLLVSILDLAADPKRAAQGIVERLAGQRVHVSFDIDALDPAYAPATEIPSAGGLSTREALDLLRAVAQRSVFIGMDVVEVAPPFDSADITSLAALKVIFEFWGMFWHGNR
jgi:agmatinase